MGKLLLFKKRNTVDATRSEFTQNTADDVGKLLVFKKRNTVDTTGSKFAQNNADDVWIPALREVGCSDESSVSRWCKTDRYSSSAFKYGTAFAFCH